MNDKKIPESIKKILEKLKNQIAMVYEAGYTAGYCAGGEDEQDRQSEVDTESDEKKQDGWIAWHPEIVYLTVCPSENAARHMLERQMHRADQDGWRIRPVEVKFLDEDVHVNRS